MTKCELMKYSSFILNFSVIVCDLKIYLFYPGNGNEMISKQRTVCFTITYMLLRESDVYCVVARDNTV
jgi:hypothetical protein